MPHASATPSTWSGTQRGLWTQPPATAGPEHRPSVTAHLWGQMSIRTPAQATHRAPGRASSGQGRWPPQTTERQGSQPGLGALLGAPPPGRTFLGGGVGPAGRRAAQPVPGELRQGPAGGLLQDGTAFPPEGLPPPQAQLALGRGGRQGWVLLVTGEAAETKEQAAPNGLPQRRGSPHPPLPTQTPAPGNHHGRQAAPGGGRQPAQLISSGCLTASTLPLPSSSPSKPRAEAEGEQPPTLDPHPVYLHRGPYASLSQMNSPVGLGRH